MRIQYVNIAFAGGLEAYSNSIYFVHYIRIPIHKHDAATDSLYKSKSKKTFLLPNLDCLSLREMTDTLLSVTFTKIEIDPMLFVPSILCISSRH